MASTLGTAGITLAPGISTMHKVCAAPAARQTNSTKSSSNNTLWWLQPYSTCMLTPLVLLIERHLRNTPIMFGGWSSALRYDMGFIALLHMVRYINICFKLTLSSCLIHGHARNLLTYTIDLSKHYHIRHKAYVLLQCTLHLSYESNPTTMRHFGSPSRYCPK